MDRPDDQIRSAVFTWLREQVDLHKASRFARGLLACVLLIFLILPWRGAAQSVGPQIADGVISHQNLFDASMREGVACFRIPALITAPNGDLIAAIDERVPSCADLRGNPDINIVLRRSSDKGATWSEIETVIDYPLGQSASDPSMIVDAATGDVFLFYNYMDLDEAPGVYRLHVVRSEDNGKSWGVPRDITEQITRPEWQQDFLFITSGRGIQTRGGMLLHTLVHLERGVFVFGSKDHGRTWFVLETPIHPGDESKIVELSDGRWMINSRVNDAGLRYVHVSADGGRTWTSWPDSSLIDPGVNAAFIRYDLGRSGTDDRQAHAVDDATMDRPPLLFSNAASPDRREHLTVRVSFDEGETWTGRSIYPGPSAYSTITVLADGTIGLLFEKDDYSENVFVRFSLDWLLAT